MLENQTGEIIKVLYTENGTGYVIRYMQDNLKNYNIVQQKTIPYIPEKNGVTERANSMIVEKARNMMADAVLGKKFWTEAIPTYLSIFYLCR
jgi:hypothetical protein